MFTRPGPAVYLSHGFMPAVMVFYLSLGTACSYTFTCMVMRKLLTCREGVPSTQHLGITLT